MRVPFLDIARENSALEPELLIAAARVIRSGKVLYGPELEAFERELAEWHGVKHAVGVASGTDAVEIALRAIECVAAASVTAMTAVPTINAIEAAGLVPKLVDPEPDTRNSAEGRACVHVQLYGLATDATGSCVEDIAHSMGATAHGAMAGTMAQAGAVSFYPTKIMGALGDGGAVITDDDGTAARARRIRQYGFEDDGNIETRGQNSRLCEMQAAFLRVKLPRVRDWILRRREIAMRYNAELSGHVTVPFEPLGYCGVFHVYVVEHPERNRLRAELEAAGIGTMVHYPRAIHQYTRWSDLGEPGQFPVAEALAATVLSLPCYPFLTDQEQDAVIAAVKGLS